MPLSSSLPYRTTNPHRQIRPPIHMHDQHRQRQDPGHHHHFQAQPGLEQLISIRDWQHPQGDSKIQEDDIRIRGEEGKGQGGDHIAHRVPSSRSLNRNGSGSSRTPHGQKNSEAIFHGWSGILIVAFSNQRSGQSIPYTTRLTASTTAGTASTFSSCFRSSRPKKDHANIAICGLTIISVNPSPTPDTGFRPIASSAPRQRNTSICPSQYCPIIGKVNRKINGLISVFQATRKPVRLNTVQKGQTYPAGAKISGESQNLGKMRDKPTVQAAIRKRLIIPDCVHPPTEEKGNHHHCHGHFDRDDPRYPVPIDLLQFLHGIIITPGEFPHLDERITNL